MYNENVKFKRTIFNCNDNYQYGWRRVFILPNSALSYRFQLKCERTYVTGMPYQWNTDVIIAGTGNILTNIIPINQSITYSSVDSQAYKIRFVRLSGDMNDYVAIDLYVGRPDNGEYHTENNTYIIYLTNPIGDFANVTGTFFENIQSFGTQQTEIVPDDIGSDILIRDFNIHLYGTNLRNSMIRAQYNAWQGKTLVFRDIQTASSLLYRLLATGTNMGNFIDTYFILRYHEGNFNLFQKDLYDPITITYDLSIHELTIELPSTTWWLYSLEFIRTYS